MNADEVMTVLGIVSAFVLGIATAGLIFGCVVILTEWRKGRP